MRHQHIAIRNGSRVSPLAKLTAQEFAQLRRARRLALLKLRRARQLALLRRRRLSTAGPPAKPREKVYKQSVNIPSVLLTVIIAGALAFASVSLMHPISTRSSKKGPPLLGKAASVSQTTSPVFVGTEHPVPVDPTSLQTTSAKHESSNPVTAPTPQPSVVFGENSRREVEPLSKEAREKLEWAREAAERQRAYVEYLYQKHLIPEEVYKESQAEYQQEIAKYEDQIAKYRSLPLGRHLRHRYPFFVLRMVSRRL